MPAPYILTARVFLSAHEKPGGAKLEVAVGVFEGVFDGVSDADGVSEIVGVAVFDIVGLTDDESEIVGVAVIDIVGLTDDVSEIVGVAVFDIVGEFEGEFDLVGLLLGDDGGGAPMIDEGELVGEGGTPITTNALDGLGKGATAFSIEKEVFAQVVIV